VPALSYLCFVYCPSLVFKSEFLRPLSYLISALVISKGVECLIKLGIAGCRYYLKTNGTTETLVPDEMAPELVRESQVHFLQLNAVEVAIQLTLQDFSIFRQIESTEYVDDLFELKSRYGVPMLSQFAEVSRCCTSSDSYILL
jgi:hypothetical protein